MSKFIAAYHPVTGGKANFEEQAFEAVWKDLGWVEGEARMLNSHHPRLIWLPRLQVWKGRTVRMRLVRERR